MNNNYKETKTLISILGWIFFPAIIIFGMICLFSGGKTIHDINNEKLEKIESKIDSMKEGTGFNQIKFYINKYNNHEYIITCSWTGNSEVMSMVHSPDCQCLKNK